MIKIAENIIKFGQEVAAKVGNYEAEMFDVGVYNQIQDRNIASPIEQLVFMAINCHARIFRLGLKVDPQFEIGKYRVDFKVSYYRNEGDSQSSKTVLVECDSQQFHERSESERRYEKQRDRDLQKCGYKIFRFTGSEITKDPYKISSEILEYLTGISQSEIKSSLENL